MKVAGIRELRSNTAALLGGSEPVLVTRHGRVSGVYLPLSEPDRLPSDLRKELSSVMAELLSNFLERAEVSEADVAEDFSDYRRSRR